MSWHFIRASSAEEGLYKRALLSHLAIVHYNFKKIFRLIYNAYIFSYIANIYKALHTTITLKVTNRMGGGSQVINMFKCMSILCGYSINKANYQPDHSCLEWVWKGTVPLLKCGYNKVINRCPYS